MTPDYNFEFWENKCLRLLRKATISQGIKASCKEITNYGAVFTRDAVMAGIAGLLFEDKIVIEGLKSSIENLFQTKGDQGQIASNIKIGNDGLTDISFGTLSPKIDSATWYLIAIGLLLEKGYEYTIDYVESTISLLEALEYNGKDLIYIPEGGNWADEYPYEGYILYDQVLRLWALLLLGKHFDRKDWCLKADAIADKIRKEYFNESKGYYNCSFRPSGFDDTFDFAAHALLGLMDSHFEDHNYNSALFWVNKHFISNGNLPVAFYPVIDEEHPKWDSISKFHLFDFKNKPNHYHNGGIWFIWIGWYALVLLKHNKIEDLNKLANISFDVLSNIDEFNFDEYLTGDTKEPKGTQELCYTATGILFLCKAIQSQNSKIEIF